jgi:hypothetical protein
VERLACDADYRLVLRDGTRLVGVTSTAELVDDQLRALLVARDVFCRFPGCRRPAGAGVAHHVIYRSEGGPTTLSNLVALCRAHHHAVHHRGFTLELLDDGTCIWRRHRRRWVTRPPSLAPPEGLPPPDPPERTGPARPDGTSTTTTGSGHHRQDGPTSDCPF